MTQNDNHAADQMITCSVSPDFHAWLAQSGGSFVLSTYQAGKVAMIGWDGRQVTLLMRQFDKPLGLAVQGRHLALATRHSIELFADAPLLAYDYLEDQPGRYDALYLPRVSYHTGDLHVHDVAFHDGGLLFVNTRFSCLARVSCDHHFLPVWHPRFISDLVPEDRCHLNGLAMVAGRPKYVTALGTTNSAGAWRDNKACGGVVIDVETGQIVAESLSMPHSPRWHEGRLWVLNSGTGELVVIDPETGRRETVSSLPGYVRGLCLAGSFALVGMCKIREKHIFGGLPIQQRLKRLTCGVAIVDLRSGGIAGMFEFTSGCEELYDVAFLPGVRRPTILNLDKPAVREAVTNPDSSYWLRASRQRPPDGPPAQTAPRAARNGAAGENHHVDTDQNGAPRFPSAIQQEELPPERHSLLDFGTQF